MRRYSKKFLAGIATLTLLVFGLTANSTYAQAPYPTRSVTMIVPFPPGGGTDVGARIIAQRLTAKWGQSVVVENRGGAAGIVGMEAAAKAKPDGYTIIMGNVTPSRSTIRSTRSCPTTTKPRTRRSTLSPTCHW